MDNQIKFRQAQYNRAGDFTEFHYWGFIDGTFVQPETNTAAIREAHERSQRYSNYEAPDDTPIWEGDILECYFGTDLQLVIGVCKYDSDTGFVGSFDIGSGHKWQPSILKVAKDCVVLGNIIENPELLTEHKV